MPPELVQRILSLRAQGVSAPQIAFRLGLSVSRVKHIIAETRKELQQGKHE